MRESRLEGGTLRWMFARLTFGRTEEAKPEPVSSKYLAQHEKQQQILLIFRRRIKRIPVKEIGAFILVTFVHFLMMCEVE